MHVMSISANASGSSMNLMSISANAVGSCMKFDFM